MQWQGCRQSRKILDAGPNSRTATPEHCAEAVFLTATGAPPDLGQLRMPRTSPSVEALPEKVLAASGVIPAAAHSSLLTCLSVSGASEEMWREISLRKYESEGLPHNARVILIF
jgi:hypothetical protein